MHINKSTQAYPVYLLFVIFLIIGGGCKGKGGMHHTEGPILLESRETSDENSIPPSKKAEDAKLQPIINSPPRITKFEVDPKIPVIGDTIRAIVETYDKDEDNVAVRYQWAKNDTPIDAVSNVLKLSDDFKRGDKISVKAIPDDGKVKGTPLAVVMHVANAPPVLQSVSDAFKIEGDFYTNQIKAYDPDGDPLLFLLKDAPEGMTIDPDNGSVRWKVPSQFTGNVQYRVSVTDSHGGETIATIALDIQTKQIEVKP